MIRCYITDRRACPVNLLDNIEQQARSGVQYIQLREKDLTAHELADLARGALQRTAGTETKLIINTRVDVCLAAGAHGVHLPSDSIRAADWRRAFPKLIIGVSCHAMQDLANAAPGADFAFYSPIFDSPGKGPALGLESLAKAARRSPVPLLALGGITPDNATACVEAGAAGIAAIRMFQTPVLHSPKVSS